MHANHTICILLAFFYNKISKLKLNIFYYHTAFQTHRVKYHTVFNGFKYGTFVAQV